MGKIDTSGWKEFHMTDIGFKVYHGSRITKAERVEGDTVFLTAGFENCGVVGTIGNENIDVWEKPITVDMFGNVFYHDEACAGDDNIYAFLNSKLSKAAKLFVASAVVSVTQSKYSYQQQFRQGDANKLSVYLPCTHDGDPDWAYMESYMANLETKVADSLALLQAAKDAEKKKVDTREWGEFKFGDLFDLHGIKQAKSQKLIPTVELSDGIPCVPYIVQSQFNNMVGRYVDKQWLIENNEPPVEGNALVLGVTLNACSYQPEEFGASQVITARSPCLNKNNGFFIAAIVRKRIEQFDYKEKPSFEKYRALKIMLPIDKTGQPDWAYMEEYMRKVERKTDGMLNQFVST